MNNKSKPKKATIFYLPELVLDTEKERESNGLGKHGMGKNCSNCLAKKKTKKVGKKFLCDECREILEEKGLNAETR